MLKELINNFYLDEKEAMVYLAALELGRSRVSRIAKKADLNRITAYEILKRFVTRGIAYSAEYRSIKTFTVVAPEILIEKQESRLEVAKNILPELTLLTGTKATKPQISYFEGAEGIRTIYQDTLTTKNQEILNIAHPQNLLQIIGKRFFDQYVKKRVKRDIKVKVLLPNTLQNKQYETETSVAKRQVKFFDQKRYPLPNEILIYDNKIALLSFSSIIGVVIEDCDIAQSAKSWWRMAWNNL